MIIRPMILRRVRTGSRDEGTCENGSGAIPGGPQLLGPECGVGHDRCGSFELLIAVYQERGAVDYLIF
jgi:hypothetical protein